MWQTKVMMSSNLMAFVSNHTVKPSNSKAAAKNLTMRHLVWETRSVQDERRQACICSHFVLDVLLNDVLCGLILHFFVLKVLPVANNSSSSMLGT